MWHSTATLSIRDDPNEGHKADRTLNILYCHQSILVGPVADTGTGQQIFKSALNALVLWGPNFHKASVRIGFILVSAPGLEPGTY